MSNSAPPILVLGANGFLGSHVTMALLSAGRKVRGFDCRWDLPKWTTFLARGDLDIHQDSISSDDSLRRALEGVDTVINLLSFSVPSTSPKFLQVELEATLSAMDRLCASMVQSGASKLVYISSGGAIYGEGTGAPARESDPLLPTSSYGMGKLMCEEIVRFYGRVHGLQYLIVRPSNPYGASLFSRKSQGVIDVFLEKILAGQSLDIWGNINAVRDYIFIDDLVEALVSLIGRDDASSRILNLGSGCGTSLQDVIECIGRVTSRRTEWSVDPQKFSGVSSCVLDISALQELTGWKPRYSLDQGIQETWRRKKAFRQRRVAA